jgi:hypothetical protein
VIDSINYRDIADGSAGSFINLELIKKRTKTEIKWFVREPLENNLITIRRDILNKQESELIIIHELYHYIDKLIGINGGTGNYNFNQFIDTNITLSNKDYVAKKYAILVRNSMVENNTKEKIEDFELLDDDNQKVDIYPLCKQIIDSFLKNKRYYASNPEIFARWLTLKTDMIQNNIIPNDKQIITLSDIENYLKHKPENKNQCHDILLIIDWESLDKLQEYLNQDKTLP